MQTYQYDPEVHYVPRNLELAQQIRKQLGWQNLVVYLHQQTRKWVLSIMLKDKPGFLEDVIILGPEGDSPPTALMSKDKLREADYILNGPPTDPCRTLRSEDRRIAREEQEEENEDYEVRKFLNRRTRTDYPGYD